MSRSKWPGNMSRGDQKFFQNGRFLETACGSVPNGILWKHCIVDWKTKAALLQHMVSVFTS